MYWQKLLTDYWGQITLILFGIAYFIKRIFDSKSKKTEINHSLFQQNRINAITLFLNNYANVILMWQRIEIWNILSNKLTVAEIDNTIFPPLNNLKQSVFELMIYFDELDHREFEKIMDNFMEVNATLGNLYFNPSKFTTVSEMVTVFNSKKDKIIVDNNKILNGLLSKIKNSFK